MVSPVTMGCAYEVFQNCEFRNLEENTLLLVQKYKFMIWNEINNLVDTILKNKTI